VANEVSGGTDFFDSLVDDFRPPKICVSGPGFTIGVPRHGLPARRDTTDIEAEGIFGGLESPRAVADGKVARLDSNIVGEVVEGDVKCLIGLRIDEDDCILDKLGNVKGHAVPLEGEEEPESEALTFIK
jgi:hypothetical protein